MADIFQKLYSKISKSLTNRIAEDSSRANRVSSSTQKIYCRLCGKDNSVSLERCMRCGMPITVHPSQVMKVCTKCGLAVNDDSAYCYSCGTKLFS